jgi:hypothetical protein
MLMEVVKPAGAIGIPGVYTDQDPGAPAALNKQGKIAWAFPPRLGSSRRRRWPFCAPAFGIRHPQGFHPGACRGKRRS